jgi:hypothetical protein
MKDTSQKNKFRSKFIPLSLALIILVVSTSPFSSLQLVKEAEAAGLTNVSVVPASNIINERATYDIFLETATTGTIKTIEMTFPPSFDLTAATRYIERSGIGSGSLSSSGSTLKYTVNSPESVPAGTNIRLEIAKIVAGAEGSFTVSIRTSKTGSSGTLDGPTDSGVFTIKSIGTNDILDNKVSSSDIKDNSITGSDISTALMIQKTLHDDTVGNTRGWNPDGSKKAFAIADPDISSAPNSQFVSMMVRSENAVFCSAAGADTGLFVVYCNSAPQNSADINYIITKLPSHDVTSSLSASSESSPSSVSSYPHTSALPDVDSINRQDETSSEFP